MESRRENKQSKSLTKHSGDGMFFSGDAFHKKIKVNAPNDHYEKEAEMVAGQVMSSTSNSDRQKSDYDFNFEPGKSQSVGNSLPIQTKRQMEGAFGRNFSDVRIHSDEQSSEFGKKINAKAFTVGSDIYFQSKYFNPKEGVGKRLLAHELAHTLQQKHESNNISIQREGEEKTDKADEKPKVETKVEVATEYKGGEIKPKAATTRSGEAKVSEGVTAKASEKIAGETITTSADLTAKDKSTGLSASTGIKAEETPLDINKPDTAKAYFKVNGSWTLFDSKLKLNSGVTAETDFTKAPLLSVDGKAVFFPNGRLTPEIAGRFVFDKNMPSGKIEPGLSLKITDMLSAKAGVPIDIGSDGKVKAGVGLGLVFKFKGL